MAATLLMLPPQTPTTRAWAARLAGSLPKLSVVVAEGPAEAARAVEEAEAAFGTMPPALLARAARLRWLEAPQAAPPAGYYYPELIAHPVVVTNFREIYNDHIGAHIMAFVLAFALSGGRATAQRGRQIELVLVQCEPQDAAEPGPRCPRRANRKEVREWAS